MIERSSGMNVFPTVYAEKSSASSAAAMIEFLFEGLGIRLIIFLVGLLNWFQITLKKPCISSYVLERVF